MYIVIIKYMLINTLERGTIPAYIYIFDTGKVQKDELP